MFTNDQDHPDNPSSDARNEEKPDVYSAEIVEDEDLAPQVPSVSMPAEPIQDEFDLEGLSMQQAQEYVLAYIQTAKQYQRDLENQAAELEKWTKRVTLAQSKNDAALTSEAQKMVTQTEEKVNSLRKSHQDLMVKADILKMRFFNKSKQVPMTGNDPDILLMQLEQMTGETAGESKTKEDLDHLSLRDRLSSLKNKLNKNEPPTEPKP